MSTPAVGQVIDEGNVDEFLLPDKAIVIDGDGDAWQKNGRYLYSTTAECAYDLADVLRRVPDPLEVAWLPPVDPTPHLAAVQESLERRAA